MKETATYEIDWNSLCIGFFVAALFDNIARGRGLLALLDVVMILWNLHETKTS